MFFTNAKPVIVWGLIGIIAMSFLGLYSMPLNEHGKMTNCPFMGNSSSMCQMSATRHIAKWQELFTFIKKDGSSSFVFFIIVVILILKPYYNNDPPLSKFRFYLKKYRQERALFNYLLLVFSRGILHPQVYA